MSSTSAVLEVSDRYASLEGFDSKKEEMHFRLSYRVDLAAALNAGALKTKVSIYRKNLPPPPPKPGARSTIAEHQTYQQDVQVYIDNIRKMRIKEVNDDLTSYMSNAAVNAGDVSLLPVRRKIIAVPESKLGATKGEIVSKVIDTSNVDYSGINKQRLMFDILLKDGIDPSNVVNMTKKHVSPDDKVAILAGSLDDKNSYDSTYVLVSQIDDTNVVEAYVDVTLALSDFSSDGTPIVIFDLYNDKEQASIASVTKTLDYMNHLRVLSVPLTPPTVTSTSDRLSGWSTIKIKQNDPNANTVRIFYKKIHGSLVQQSTYDPFDQIIKLSHKQETSIQVLTPRDYPVIYRFVAYKDDQASPEYTNVVLTPKKTSDMNSISLTATCVNDGIDVEISSVPSSASSVMLCRRNKTLKEKSWTNIDVPQQVKVLGPKDQTLVVSDRSLIPGHVYEYSTIVQYNSGVLKRCGDEKIEYVQSTLGKAKLLVDNVFVENRDNSISDINVKFDISLSLNDTDQTVLLSLLEAAGVKDFYSSDLSAIKEKFNSLLTCNIHRVNLTTGMRENFGILRSESFKFSEINHRQNRGIAPPERGSKYRYVISAMLRDAETMTSHVVERKTKHGNSYSYDPRKFAHPVILSTGTVFTDEGLTKQFSKSELEFGELGLFHYVDVDLTDVQPAVQNLTLTNFDRNTNIISWSLVGSEKLVDHFLIAKKVFGLQTFIGKVHPQLNNGGFYTYYHNFDNPDVGELQYVVIPVLNNYAVGVRAETSTIVSETT